MGHVASPATLFIEEIHISLSVFHGGNNFCLESHQSSGRCYMGIASSLF